MSQMQSTIAMPVFDSNLLVAAEKRYNKLLREQRSRRQAVGDFEECQRLEDLQREKDRFKRQMPLPDFDRYIQNVYQREREIKEGREREMKRGTLAWNGPSLTPLMGHFQNVWQGLPNPQVAMESVSTANANGHNVGVRQRPFLQIASAVNVNMSGHRAGERNQLSAAAVSPASSANEDGQIAGENPHSDRQWNPEARPFQPRVVAAPETCSQPSSEQPSLTPATPEDVPIESVKRRDSGYVSDPASPTKSQPGANQEAPEIIGSETQEESLGEEQEQPAAAKVPASQSGANQEASEIIGSETQEESLGEEQEQPAAARLPASQSGTNQEAPEKIGIETQEESLGEEQEQPAAAKVPAEEGRKNLTTLPGWPLKHTNRSFLGPWVPRILREGYNERCERILEELAQWDANRTKPTRALYSKELDLAYQSLPHSVVRGLWHCDRVDSYCGTASLSPGFCCVVALHADQLHRST